MDDGVYVRGCYAIRDQPLDFDKDYGFCEQHYEKAEPSPRLSQLKCFYSGCNNRVAIQFGEKGFFYCPACCGPRQGYASGELPGCLFRNCTFNLHR